MRKQKLLNLLSMLLVLLSSCSSVPVVDGGPSITGCIVDLKAGGYQCASPKKDPFFVGFSDAEAMECLSHVDLEAFLKGCKEGQVIQGTLCTLKNKESTCLDPKGVAQPSDLNKMDNYFCMSSKDRSRILERCIPN